jgi:hypothetical protein
MSHRYVHSIFNQSYFHGTAVAIIDQNLKSVEATYFSQDEAEYFLSIYFNTFNQTNVYTIRDNTQQKRYKSLIDQELARSDQLLEAILSPKLVPRVFAKETNIFSVQSVSVVFPDAVEFTP